MTTKPSELAARIKESDAIVVIQISKVGVEDPEFREFIRHHYAEKFPDSKVVFDVLDV